MSEVYAQIEHLIDVRRHADARRLLQSVFNETPNDLIAHVQAARIAYLEDDNDLAWRHLGQALQSDPKHTGARVLCFYVLLDQERYPEAERQILELIQENPRDADLIAAYARLMLITANVKKAEELVSEARRIAPQHEEARLVAVIAATAMGKRAPANQHLADLIRDNPESRPVATTLLLTLIEQNRIREAFAIGQELLRADPSDTDLVDLLVDLRVQTHWLAWPLYPIQRWGWVGSAIIWIGAIVTFQLLRSTSLAIAGPLALIYLAWVIYSWVYPSLMSRWLRRRGV